MSRFRRGAVACLVASLLLGLGAMHASAQTVFGEKLGFVARNNSNQNNVMGTGWVRATLDGMTLVVVGEFENLGSMATAAHIHLAPPGQHGPVVFPLEFTAGTSGTLSGTFELTEALLAELMAVNLYVNVHSELSPRGVIRAWLVPVE